MAKRYIRLVGTATGSSVKKRFAFVFSPERAIVTVDSVEAIQPWPTELAPYRARGRRRDFAARKRGVPFAIR